MQGSRKTWVDQNLNLWCLNIPAAFWYCWLVHGWSTVLEMLLRRLTCKMITHWPFVSWISCYFLSFPYWQLNQAGTFCSSHTPAMLPRHEMDTCVSAGCSLERLQTWPLFLVHSWGSIVILKWMQNCKNFLFSFLKQPGRERTVCSCMSGTGLGKGASKFTAVAAPESTSRKLGHSETKIRWNRGYVST